MFGRKMDITNAKNPKNMENNSILDEQRAAFVASLGHDLKNPTLAQIRALELFLKGRFGTISTVQKEIIEMVLDSCKYMNAMLSSLLFTYRNQKGTISLENEKISIPELASECIDEIIYLAKDKNIKLNFANKCIIDYVYGDKIQLKRVIMNLLSNGIKYANNNSVMYINIYNEDENTCFEYKNQSPYITIEKQKQIFARYVSFADSYKLMGVGLGLYASRKIVESHSGIMFVQSSKEGTNTFGFKIPYSDKYKDIKRSVTF